MKSSNPQVEKLDKNYQPIPSRDDVYTDELTEQVSAVIDLKEKGILSDDSVKLLLKLIFAKEINNDTKDLYKWIYSKNSPKEVRTLFIDMSSKAKQYA